MTVLHVAVIVGLTLVWPFPNANAVGIEGPGARSCEYFIQNVKSEPATEEHYFTWAQGYMSGLNVARLNDERGAFQSMPMELQRAHIRTFCDANPTKQYVYAVIDLYITLYPKEATK
jgi:hypothetical protein